MSGDHLKLSLSLADAAALRRGVDPWEVRGFYGLLKQYSELKSWQVAIAAPVVAEIREFNNQTVGQLAKAHLTEARLRRLLSSRDREDLVRHLRTLIRISGRSGSPDEFVKTIAFWGESQRRRIAQDFFG